MSNKIPLALLACIIPAVAAATLRCGQSVISEGATSAEVSAKCGAPAQVDHRTQSQFAAVNNRGLVTGTSDESPIEVWTYNFGPNRLMQRIWFSDGRVTMIESLGYGF